MSNDRTSLEVVHLRIGRHTACGIPLWGYGRRANEKVEWTNSDDDANCPQCVIEALPFTILLPEDGDGRMT